MALIHSKGIDTLDQGASSNPSPSLDPAGDPKIQEHNPDSQSNSPPGGFLFFEAARKFMGDVEKSASSLGALARRAEFFGDLKPTTKSESKKIDVPTQDAAVTVLRLFDPEKLAKEEAEARKKLAKGSDPKPGPNDQNVEEAQKGSEAGKANPDTGNDKAIPDMKKGSTATDGDAPDKASAKGGDSAKGVFRRSLKPSLAKPKAEGAKDSAPESEDEESGEPSAASKGAGDIITDSSFNLMFGIMGYGFEKIGEAINGKPLSPAASITLSNAPAAPVIVYGIVKGLARSLDLNPDAGLGGALKTVGLDTAKSLGKGVICGIGANLLFSDLSMTGSKAFSGPLKDIETIAVGSIASTNGIGVAFFAGYTLGHLLDQGVGYLNHGKTASDWLSNDGSAPVPESAPARYQQPGWRMISDHPDASTDFGTFTDWLSGDRREAVPSNAPERYQQPGWSIIPDED
jgi:hypothetical protein